MKKVYIAGKITGEPRYKEYFAKGCEIARDRNVIPINPAELPEGMKPADYMAICLPMLLTADEVWLLPNWMHSQGACIEKMLAQYTGKKVKRMIFSLEAVK